MKFFVTGTQAFGPITENSDFDIVMIHEDALRLLDFLSILKIDVALSNHIDPAYLGFYFKFNHHDKVQIIVARDEIEYDAWTNATDKMKRDVPNRNERIKMFQSLFNKELLKLYNKALKRLDIKDN